MLAPPAAQPIVRLPKRIPAKRKTFIASLDTPMIWLSRNDALTLRDLVSGVHVTGGNGSGKTSASGATLARAFLKGGFGGLVCTVKHDELQTWQRYARETGRAQHLIVVSEDGPWRFNFLQYELARNAPLTTRIENVVSILVNVMTQAGNRSGGDNEYWYNQAERLLGAAIGILAAARPRFSLMEMMRFIFDAPTDRETIRSDDWPEHPFAMILADARAAYVAEGKEQDYRVREAYWLNNFISLPENTRGSIISTLDMMVNKLTTGTVREIFNTECNFFPEDTWEGAVIVLALPAAENDAFAFAQVLFKIAWQQAALRRMKDVDPKTSRPLFLFCDESHLLVAPFDTKFQSLIRAGKVCTVYMTQNLNAYYQRLPGSDPKATAKALLSYFQNQWFHANGDPETNQYAIELFGKTDYEQVTSTRGGTRTDQRGKTAKGGKDATEPEDSTNLSSSESDAVMMTIRDAVRPEEISALRTGGPHNRYRVGALVYRTGRIWKSTNALRLTVEFDQRAK